MVEKWVVEEFSPEVENWINDECVGKFTQSPESLKETIIDTFTEIIAPHVQNWVVEEFSPEVENWMNEEYSEKVQEASNLKHSLSVVQNELNEQIRINKKMQNELYLLKQSRLASYQELMQNINKKDAVKDC